MTKCQFYYHSRSTYRIWTFDTIKIGVSIEHNHTQPKLGANVFYTAKHSEINSSHFHHQRHVANLGMDGADVFAEHSDEEGPYFAKHFRCAGLVIANICKICYLRHQARFSSGLSTNMHWGQVFLVFNPKHLYPLQMKATSAAWRNIPPCHLKQSS